MTPVFKPDLDYHHRKDQAPQRVLGFLGDRLVVRKRGTRAEIPSLAALSHLGLEPDNCLWLGAIGDLGYVAWELAKAPELSAGLELVGLRALFGSLEDAEFQLAGYALQLLRWVAENRHCGRCGSPMAMAMGDRALSCTACRSTLYPRISPAVIVAITSGGRILLARSSRFPGRRMFSVIAGYVEPGETLEDCVRREIREEVGLTVRRIRYFGSQAWPFSGSLMVGFTAEHAGGQIRVDGREILEADWFSPAALPEIPGKISIARQLIDWFVDHH